MPRRNSTADRRNGGLGGCAARHLRGRVDLRAIADRPSTYWRYKAQQIDPTRRSARAQRDDQLKGEITRVWHEQEQVYGPDKVWRQLGREEIRVARCTVERLMKALELRGVVRGGRGVVTTRPEAAAVMPDLVDRQFTASRPNQLWVSDFNYVATADGFVYTAFVIDIFARRIVGWNVSHAMRTDFVLAALEQALHQRGDEMASLVHHSDRGVQLGFKGPSQRVRVSLSLSDFEVPLQAFSSRASFAGDC